MQIRSKLMGRRKPQLSAGGVVPVSVGPVPTPVSAVHVRLLRGRGGILRMTGRLHTDHRIVTGAQFQLKGRATDRRLAAPITLRPADKLSANRLAEHWYRFAVRMDWATLWDGRPEPRNDVFDAWARLTFDGQDEPESVRIGITRYRVRKLSRPTWVRSGRASAAIEPYYTLRRRSTSFRVDFFSAEAMRYLRRHLWTRHVDRLRYRGKPIWLLGELPYKAQDTGLAMFRYLRANHPEIDAYYVMDTSSSEYANVAGLGNVVEHRSPEHVRLSLLAERVIGSHHPEYLYPLRTARYRRAVRAPRVFLQHGVMAIKWMALNYGKGESDFDTDVFIVSSEREKQYIVSDFGWRPDEVAVTGLTRFDTLFADDVPVRRQLLIMPTWRNWLLDADIYIESEFHRRLSSLLHSARLAQLATEHDLAIVLCLHPNMQPYRRLYTATSVHVVGQGEVDVQHLLKQSAVLITDFSSVGFDFAFLDKPVIFYQYDRTQTLGVRGAHIDLDRELPGTVAFTEVGLLDALERACLSEFAPEPGMRERADVFIAQRDQRNSERVFEVARDAARHRWQRERVLARPLPAVAFRLWRRSRAYSPMMRLMFGILRRLPTDENRVVFEAGLGRQFADSPRCLYEELVRRGSPMTKIWAYSGKVHTPDRYTRVVERMSPGYFWHLGRAKYWVNSQNFPYYLTRRPDGVFVQTWHGTPLKRMLQDVAEVHGRDSGYVGRMLQAAAQWSLLVSPSPFATSAISGAYGYTGPALEVGYPRNDSLLAADRDDQAKQIRARLGIPSDARVILYAPTFRDDRVRGRGRFDFEMPFDLERAAERLDPDTVLLLRMHVVVSAPLEIPRELEHRVMDVSAYPEIQELYLASDAVITDYSSVFFDYALLRRPIIFYAYDLASYRDRLRGFYLDYDKDLPGPIVTTEDELFDTLVDLDSVAAQYADRFDDFLARFAPHDDGQATQRVVDAVFGRRSKRA